jgi:4-amino-4-deoxy-L-arabinose transferase-like glycosyltransferase
MKRRELLAVAALTALALALRLYRLGYFDLWTDEGATWFFARWAMGTAMGGDVALEATPPLYYGLVGVFLWFFGDSDVVLRLPSALFGAASIPALYLLGRRLVSPRVGMIGALLLTFHPLHLFYSREARVYPLLLLLTILWLDHLAKALEQGTSRAWARFGGLLLLTCAVHLTGLFLGLASGILILILAPTARIRRQGIVALLLVGLFTAPYVGWILPQLGPSGAAWFTEASYRHDPDEKTLGRMLEQQLIGARYTLHLRQLHQPPTPFIPRLAALLSQAILLLVALAFGLRTARHRSLVLLLGAWLVPVAAQWGLNVTWRAVFQAGRHDFYTLGAVTLLLATGFEGLLSRRRWGSAAFLTLVLLASVGLRLMWLDRLPPGDRHEAAAAWIVQHLDDQDQVIAMGLRRLLVERYTRLEGSKIPFSSFPASTDNHPGWADVNTLVQDQEALRSEAQATVPALRGKRVCVLLRPHHPISWQVDGHLLESLGKAGWRVVWRPQDPALNLVVLERPSPLEPSP